MNSTRTEKAYSIEDLIASGRDSELTFATSSIICGDSNVSFAYRNIFEKYIELLRASSELIELSDEDLIKYKYNPHLLSYVLYGTTDLWFLLLRLNNLYSVTGFNRSTILVLHPKKISLINDIHIVEQEHLKDFYDFDSFIESKNEK